MPNKPNETEDTWTVWSDSRRPLLPNATEEEAKQFVEDPRNAPRGDLYIQDPEGNEYVLEGGRWVAI
jgi:hypothetical protein